MRTTTLVLLLSVVAVGAALLPGARPAAANPLGGIVAIAAGTGHTCALTDQGGVKCWGDNFRGQLGDGTTVLRTAPVDVVGLERGVTAIAAGTIHTCAITEADPPDPSAEGVLVCWGANFVGQLGAEEEVSCIYLGVKAMCSTIPLPVAGLETGVAAVDAGSLHTCAVTNSGGVKCWGWNELGLLGDGTTSQRTTPVDVVGLSEGVTALAVGRRHSCALTDAPALMCWGRNQFGSLGADSDGFCTDAITDMESSCSTIPLEVAGLPAEPTAVTVGSGHTCAIVAGGGVYCWGANASGQLGTEATGPCPVPDFDLCSIQPLSVDSLQAGVTALDASFLGSTCAITLAGKVMCWGRNRLGILGDGTTTDHTLPADVLAQAGGPALSGMAAVALGRFHACALGDDGGVKCWGGNCCGQLGAGFADFDLDPHPIPLDVLQAKPGPTPTATSTPTPSPTRTPNRPAPGDADCDAAITAADAALVLRFHAGLVSSLCFPQAADTNADGRIDSVDAALILQHVAGLMPGVL